MDSTNSAVETQVAGPLVGGLPDAQIRSLRERFMSDPTATDLSSAP